MSDTPQAPHEPQDQQHEPHGQHGQHEQHEQHEQHGHGTSVAAWTATGGVILGSLVVALFMIFWSVPGMVVGAVVIVLSALAGPVLVRAGYGEKTPNREFTGGPRAVR